MAESRGNVQVMPGGRATAGGGRAISRLPSRTGVIATNRPGRSASNQIAPASLWEGLPRLDVPESAPISVTSFRCPRMPITEKCSRFQCWRVNTKGLPYGPTRDAKPACRLRPLHCGQGLPAADAIRSHPPLRTVRHSTGSIDAPEQSPRRRWRFHFVGQGFVGLSEAKVTCLPLPRTDFGYRATFFC